MFGELHPFNDAPETIGRLKSHLSLLIQEQPARATTSTRKLGVGVGACENHNCEEVQNMEHLNWRNTSTKDELTILIDIETPLALPEHGNAPDTKK